MDIILCRNVLIYFDRETVRRVAGRLFASLAEGGWLLTASSDPPLAEDAPFEVVTANEGVFYHKPGADSPASGGREPGEPGRVSAGSTPGAHAPRSQESDEPAEPEPERPRRQLRPDPLGSPEEAARHVRWLANRGVAEAERACAEATARHPLSAELHYLHAVLLLEAGRDEEAVRAVRRVLYLDPSLAVAHFTLGAILSRRGDLPGARRAYRNARDLCATLPAEEPVPLSDGEPAGRLAAAASAQLALLEEDRP
jgi:chemotaxis protein methyltransferase CheR